jgi:phosphinothricin acetyltransferase
MGDQVSDDPPVEVTIAKAREEHIEGITDIYNDAILNTTATFDATPKTVEEQRGMLMEHDDAHPVIVALAGDEMAGWGSLSAHNDRCCYGRTVEDSIYVRRDMRGRGIGTLILNRLIAAAGEADHHAIIARIDGGNAASFALHRKMGFEEVGRLREVGHKFGRWLDVVMMEMVL